MTSNTDHAVPFLRKEAHSLLLRLRGMVAARCALPVSQFSLVIAPQSHPSGASQAGPLESGPVFRRVIPRPNSPGLYVDKARCLLSWFRQDGAVQALSRAAVNTVLSATGGRSAHCGNLRKQLDHAK